MENPKSNEMAARGPRLPTPICSASDPVEEDIRFRQERFASLFAETPWTEEVLSNAGWLGLVGVPILLAKIRGDSDTDRYRRNPYSNPRTDSIGSSPSPLEFMVPEKAKAQSFRIAESCNPVANLFVRFVVKTLAIFGLLHLSLQNVEGRDGAND